MGHYYPQMVAEVVEATEQPVLIPGAIGCLARVATEGRVEARVVPAETAETVPCSAEAVDATRVLIMAIRLAKAAMAECMVVAVAVDIAVLLTDPAVLAAPMAVMVAKENRMDRQERTQCQFVTLFSRIKVWAEAQRGHTRKPRNAEAEVVVDMVAMAEMADGYIQARGLVEAAVDMVVMVVMVEMAVRAVAEVMEAMAEMAEMRLIMNRTAEVVAAVHMAMAARADQPSLREHLLPGMVYLVAEAVVPEIAMNRRVMAAPASVSSSTSSTKHNKETTQ